MVVNTLHWFSTESNAFLGLARLSPRSFPQASDVVVSLIQLCLHKLIPRRVFLRTREETKDSGKTLSTSFPALFSTLSSPIFADLTSSDLFAEVNLVPRVLSFSFPGSTLLKMAKGDQFLKKLWCCVGGGVVHENLVYQRS